MYEYREKTMNRDDIIRMAREAGISIRGHYDETGSTPQELERFAALVAAAERNLIWTQSHWTEYELNIVAAEREACAQVCETEGLGAKYQGDVYAAAIRARGEK